MKKLIKWIFVGFILVGLCGCAHIRYGGFEYWRLGKQEITRAAFLSEPNRLSAIIEGQKGGEKIVPSIATTILGGKLLGGKE